MCEVLGGWRSETKSAWCWGQIGMGWEDRRAVGEDGTCGFVSDLKHLEASSRFILH